MAQIVPNPKGGRMAPLTFHEAAHIKYGSPMWLEEKEGGFCNVRPVNTWGYSQKAVLVIGGEPPWMLDMSFSLNAGPNACSAGAMALSSTDYNKTWRLWPSQPSIEESRGAAWE